MPSPFPGMDPWLEDPAIFPDLHDSFIVEMRKAIMLRLPRPYYAALRNRVWVDLSLRHIEPDVDVLYPAHREKSASVATKKKPPRKLIAVEPIVVDDDTVIENDDMEENYLEIFARHGGEQLVTTIELLSLTNKKEASRGREMYRQKQAEVRASKGNLVEIDLLRGGAHTTLVSRTALMTKAGVYDYHICVHAMDEPGRLFTYPWRLETRLPNINIPLLPGDAPIVVDLQAVLDECYDAGGYDRRMRYREWKIDPPLTKTQAAWAERLLKAARL